MSLMISFKQASTFDANFVQRLINEINALRRNPQGYISIIQSERYRNDYPASEIRETVQFLQRQRACNNDLRINPLLSEMAQRWVNLQGRGLTSEPTGHGDLSQRLREANIPLLSGSYSIAENIAYGLIDPRDIVVAWIIDWRVPGKGHRSNLFRCDLNQIGIGYGTYTNPQHNFRVMVVNEYGSGFASQR